jgi:hypothetical protein
MADFIRMLFGTGKCAVCGAPQRVGDKRSGAAETHRKRRRRAPPGEQQDRGPPDEEGRLVSRHRGGSGQRGEEHQVEAAALAIDSHGVRESEGERDLQRVLHAEAGNERDRRRENETEEGRKQRRFGCASAPEEPIAEPDHNEREDRVQREWEQLASSEDLEGERQEQGPQRGRRSGGDFPGVDAPSAGVGQRSRHPHVDVGVVQGVGEPPDIPRRSHVEPREDQQVRGRGQQQGTAARASRGRVRVGHAVGRLSRARDLPVRHGREPESRVDAAE